MTPLTNGRPRAVAPARLPALGAVAGPALFTLAWLVLGQVSSGYTLYDHEFTTYSPISQPVSGLGMGSTAALMNTAFVVTGLMLIAGVVGIVGTVPALGTTAGVLLGLTGLGQVMDGIFNLEAMLPHSIGFLLALGTPVVSFLVVGSYLRRDPGWRRFGGWLRLGSPVALLLLILFFATFQPTAEGAEQGVAGLIQRIGILHVHGWFVALGWLAYRPRPSIPASRPRDRAQ
jgi:hypothetical membrane protein